jgi:rubredoxin
MTKSDLDRLLQEVQDAVAEFENDPCHCMVCRDCGLRMEYTVQSITRKFDSTGPGPLRIDGWNAPAVGWVHVSTRGQLPSYALCPTCAIRKQL